MCISKFFRCQIPDGRPIATQVADRINAEEVSAACEMAWVAVKHYLANCNDTIDVSFNVYLDDEQVLSAVSRKYILRPSVQRHVACILEASHWKVGFSGYTVSIEPIADAPVLAPAPVEPTMRGTI